MLIILSSKKSVSNPFTVLWFCTLPLSCLLLLVIEKEESNLLNSSTCVRFSLNDTDFADLTLLKDSTLSHLGI
jgi:hypothetical protein